RRCEGFELSGDGLPEGLDPHFLAFDDLLALFPQEILDEFRRACEDEPSDGPSDALSEHEGRDQAADGHDEGAKRPVNVYCALFLTGQGGGEIKRFREQRLMI